MTTANAAGFNGIVKDPDGLTTNFYGEATLRVGVTIGPGGPEEILSGQNMTNEGQTLNGFGI